MVKPNLIYQYRQQACDSHEVLISACVRHAVNILVEELDEWPEEEARPLISTQHLDDQDVARLSKR